MNAIKNPIPVGSGFIDSRQEDMATTSPSAVVSERRALGGQKAKATSPHPGSVAPRLKLTKPRKPKSDSLEVDWEEDLRPTPIETKGNEQVAASVPDLSKGSSVTNKKSTAKREMKSREPKISPKRRKANPKKSAIAKKNNDKVSQLPLIILNTGIASAAKDNPSMGLGISDGKIKSSVTKNNVNMSEASHRKLPQSNEPVGHTNKGKQPIVIEIPSGTSVSPGITSDSDDEGKGPFCATTSKVSILEYRAQSQSQENQGKSVCKRPTTAASSSSDCDIQGSSRPSASKVTILQARAQPKSQIHKAKVAHEKRKLGRHGRAESVGSKLMLALQGAVFSSQAQSNTKDKAFAARRSVLPIKPVQTKEPIQEQPAEQPPAKEPTKILEIDRAPDETAIHEKREHQSDHDLDPPNEESVDQPNQATTEEYQHADLTQAWETSSSTHGDSSDLEVGRGLVGDHPSILDYHMEMEHLPGFSALEPLRSMLNTSSQASNLYPSQKDTSSDVSSAGLVTQAHLVTQAQEITAASAQGREFTHTPESQKPLLANETLMELDSSPKPPKSVPKASIVDSNGSPRLMQRQIKDGIVSQLDLEDNSNQKKDFKATDTSASQYSRSSCDPATDDTHESIVWTKFQRDMFLEYGIETDKLKQTRLDSRPRSVNHPSSLPQEGTAEAMNACRASTSSQRTIDDKQVKATALEDRGPMDRTWCYKAPELHRADIQSQPCNSAHDPMEWITALGVAQKNAHDLLEETNLHLSNQLAAEKVTITRVLEIYRQGCGQILDDLFKAQEARMQMYQQQMQYVKGQHAIICDDMVRGLQELDRRVQRGP